MHSYTVVSILVLSYNMSSTMFNEIDEILFDKILEQFGPDFELGSVPLERIQNVFSKGFSLLSCHEVFKESKRITERWFKLHEQFFTIFDGCYLKGVNKGCLRIKYTWMSEDMCKMLDMKTQLKADEKEFYIVNEMLSILHEQPPMRKSIHIADFTDIYEAESHLVPLPKKGDLTKILTRWARDESHNFSVYRNQEPGIWIKLN